MKNREKISQTDFLLQNSFKSKFTFFMLGVALTIFAIRGDSKIRELCLLAVFFSTIGDLLLMDYKGMPSLIFNDKYFYVGLFSFSITQVLYCICFLSYFFNSNDVIKNGELFWPFWISTFFVLVFFILLVVDEKTSFIFGGYYYLMCVWSNLWSAILCAHVIGGRFIISAIGAFFFFVSDALILIRETIDDESTIKKLIWIFYPIGQLMIILTI